MQNYKCLLFSVLKRSSRVIRSNRVSTKLVSYPFIKPLVTFTSLNNERLDSKCIKHYNSGTNVPSVNSLKSNANEETDNSDHNSQDKNLALIQENSMEIFKEISKGDPEVEKKLKILQFEIQLLRDQYEKVPDTLKEENWKQLLQLKGMISKKKYLMFLYKSEQKKKNEFLKKRRRIDKRLEIRKANKEDSHLEYDLGKNSLFLRIYDQSLNRLLETKLASALLYSQHIIFDCSYNSFMSNMNQKFCAKQIVFAYAANRIHPAPFHLRLCNVNLEDYTMKELMKLTCSKNHLPMEVYQESYMDLYPKEKLVYLTPHAKDVLFNFNNDDIYIIGAFVDRGTGEKVSLAKAKENNLRMAKFPIDYFLDWKKGIKSLPLNIVLNILLDLRICNDWKEAFKCMPTRFLTPPRAHKSKKIMCVP